MALSLTDIPTVRPAKAGVFLLALPLIIFIFFFTQPKPSDEVHQPQ
ncbi:hypothetical protein QUF79_22580 [Fictibacillus enclensis]|nr:hypothetical protein [Fictibacillus enclensis]MDM5200813.1 hypothetical protein [Fictibacillus enclensis]